MNQGPVDGLAFHEMRINDGGETNRRIVGDFGMRPGSVATFLNKTSELWRMNLSSVIVTSCYRRYNHAARRRFHHHLPSRQQVKL